MQASRATTTALLTDYDFSDHTFTFHTVAALQHSLSFYGRRHMRILCMCLPEEWKEPLVNSMSGRSVLPASLVALTLGSVDRSAARYAAVLRRLSGEGMSEQNRAVRRGETEFYCRIELIDADDEESDYKSWESFDGQFHQPIPPGALPNGLRVLRLNGDQPLQAGSIPATVELLQFGEAFTQPLEAGHLPVSLTQLDLGLMYRRPLLPGVLPAGLQRLHLGETYNQPLQPGTLPAELRALHLGGRYNHMLLSGTLPPQLKELHLGDGYKQPIGPDVIPPSVTRLRLSRCFNQPLQPGCIPQGVVYLHLGFWFTRPLLPGVLPTSLRELVISFSYDQPLLAGGLPDELEVLAFHPKSNFQHTLQPGVIPASVSVVGLSQLYDQKLVAGGIPATVRWLRLRTAYATQDLTGVLSPTTRVVYWRKQ